MRYDAEQIEELIAGGSLKRLGTGVRRACYALPCGRLCVKCYKSDEEIEEGKYPGMSPAYPLDPSVVRDIRKGRCAGRHNTCVSEMRNWSRLRSRLPPELLDVFPSEMELVDLPSRGLCLVEELAANADGTQPDQFADAWLKAGREERMELVRRLERLSDALARHSVRFFDPQNVMVQRNADGSFRLRIMDIEPASRTFLRVESLLPALARLKQRRRFARFLGQFNEPISMSFSITDSYAQHLAVVLTSILASNPRNNFVFHVLHSNVTEESMARIRMLESWHPHCVIRFHRIDASAFSEFPIPPGLEHVTRETYFRYLLPDVLADESRTIYSDVDVLCEADLREAWDIDLGGHLMAAVRNYDGERCGNRDWLSRFGFSKKSPYFFTGFLVMDLDGLREGGYSRRFMEATAKYGSQVAFIDLDIVNLVCEGRILELDRTWNETGRYSPFRRDVKIWHFPGFTQKPWCNIWKNITWLPYLRRLARSPYRANALRFVWGHVKGFFFFRYTKKNVTRYLVCGIRVWRKGCPS